MSSLSKQVPMNLLTNMGVFMLNIVINLFMTPFYIKYLGVDGLGVLRLALLLPVYVNLATLIISGAVSRFLTIDLQKKHYENANITFNTSFFGISTILIFAVPLVVYFALHITSFLDIPELYSEQSVYLFLGIFISSQITIFSTLFLIPAYANNRLDIQNYIKIAILFFQTSTIIIAFIFISSNISYVGYAYTASALLGVMCSLFAWRKFAPFLTINRDFFRIDKLKEMTSMGSWLLVNQLGSILFLSIDLIIINHFFGSNATGEYSIVLQWSILLRSMAGMVASVLNPVILISYAKNNIEDIIKYSRFAVKFMGILIAIPIGLLMGFAAPLFTLWLGPEFVKLVPLLWLMVGHLVINLSMLPLFSINTAYNRVKIPGLISLIFGLFNFFLAILLAVTFDLDIYGVALAGAIVLTAKNAIFTPLYTASVIGKSKTVFSKYFFSGIFVLILSFMLSYGLSTLGIDSWMELIYNGLFTVFVSLAFIWYFFLNNFEKNIVKNKFITKLKGS